MLDFFISNAWAAEPAPQAGFAQFIPLILLFVIFWFLLIRPQMKQAKEHKAMVEALAKGDEVATSGGIVGKIKEVGENFLLVEVSKDVEVKVQKNAVSAVFPKGTLKQLWTIHY